MNLFIGIGKALPRILVATVVFTVILIAGFSSTIYAQCFMRGDVNLDARFDDSDLTLLADYVFIGCTGICCDAADVNDDGMLSGADLATLNAFLHLGGPPPPPPICGPDPTPDGLAPCFLKKGDVNGDGMMTPSDVVLVLKRVFLSEGILSFCRADADCNGSLNPADVVDELLLVFLSTPFPPCPDGC